MAGFLHHFLRKPPFGERVARVATASAILVLAVHWILVAHFVIVRLGDLKFLRLHYAAGIGVDWVDRWWYLFVFPFFGLLSFVVNAWLATVLAKRKTALGVLILVATAVLEIFFVAGGLIALLLNG